MPIINPDLARGSGDHLGFYATGVDALLQDIAEGTAAAPVTSAGSVVRVSRTGAVTRATIEAAGGVGTDGAEQLAALMGISLSTAAEEVQGVGVAGFASTSSTVGNPGNDTCALYGIGRVTGSGTGIGIGVYTEGRRDTATGKANGIEIRTRNQTATDGSYNTSGFSDTTGAWIVAGGTALSGVGVSFGKAGSGQWSVGIGVTGNAAIKDTTFSDDGSATTSIAINGTHTYALSVASAGGLVGIGDTPGAGIRMLVRSNSDTQVPLVAKGNSAGQSSSLFQVQDYSGALMFSVGAGGAILPKDGGNFTLGTTTGTKFGTATTQKLAFWNATPVVQQVLATGAGKTVDNVITLLQTLGLCRQS